MQWRWWLFVYTLFAAILGALVPTTAAPFDPLGIAVGIFAYVLYRMLDDNAPGRLGFMFVLTFLIAATATLTHLSSSLSWWIAGISAFTAASITTLVAAYRDIMFERRQIIGGKTR